MDIGVGMTQIFVTLLTTVSGILVLYMTQKAEFRKARYAREATAAELAKKTVETAEDLKRTVTNESNKKGQALDEIHQMVDGRLSKAMEQIEELKNEIAGLKRIISKLISPATDGKRDALSKSDVQRISDDPDLHQPQAKPRKR